MKKAGAATAGTAILLHGFRTEVLASESGSGLDYYMISEPGDGYTEPGLGYEGDVASKIKLDITGNDSNAVTMQVEIEAWLTGHYQDTHVKSAAQNPFGAVNDDTGLVTSPAFGITYPKESYDPFGTIAGPEFVEHIAETDEYIQERMRFVIILGGATGGSYIYVLQSSAAGPVEVLIEATVECRTQDRISYRPGYSQPGTGNTVVYGDITVSYTRAISASVLIERMLR